MNNITLPPSLPWNITIPPLESLLPPGTPLYVIYAILGALLAIFGIYFVRLVSAIALCGMLAYLALRYGYEVVGNITIASILLVLGLFAGLFIGYMLFRLTISIILAYIVVSYITQELFYKGLGLLGVFTIIIWVFTRLIRIVLPVILIGLGLYLIYIGLSALQIGNLLTLGIMGIAGIIGFIYQYRKHFYLW
jgi:hypothetical protein